MHMLFQFLRLLFKRYYCIAGYLPEVPEWWIFSLSRSFPNLEIPNLNN